MHNMSQLQNQTKVTLSHVCVSMQSVQYCSSHLSHMDIFSGSDLVQQRAQTSPSSPTTSSSSLSSCVGAVHTCAGRYVFPRNIWRVPYLSSNQKRAQKRAEMLHHPCILRGPQQREQYQNSKPTPGVTMMHHATKRGFKHCPGFLNSTGRLGPKRGRKCYITPAFSGVPNKGGQNQNSKPPLGVTMMPLGAPSISKYGSLVRPGAQIVALRAHCA